MNPTAQHFAATTAAIPLTATTTSSKLLTKNDLRYMPTSGLQHGHPITLQGASMLPTAAGTGSLLHVFPMQMNGTATLVSTMPQMLFTGGVSNAASTAASTIASIAPPMQVQATLCHNAPNNTTITTPINVVVTSGRVAATPPELSAGVAAVMQGNAGLTPSILIRNQNHNYMNATSASQRGAVAITNLNQEMVKEIVVGPAATRATQSTTLLKTRLTQQKPPRKQLQQTQNMKTSTTPLPPSVANIAMQNLAANQKILTMSEINATVAAATKMNNIVDLYKTATPVTELLKIQPQMAKPKLKTTTAPSIATNHISTTITASVAGQMPVTASKDNEKCSLLIRNVPAAMPNDALPHVTQISNTVTMSLTSAHTNNISNKNNKDKNNASGKFQGFEPANITIQVLPISSSATTANGNKPTEVAASAQQDECDLKIIKVPEKQESLLKIKPTTTATPKIVSPQKSPRTQRSKSLNGTLAQAQINSFERRHSTTAEFKLAAGADAENADKNTFIVDLDAYETEYLDISDHDKSDSVDEDALHIVLPDDEVEILTDQMQTIAEENPPTEQMIAEIVKQNVEKQEASAVVEVKTNETEQQEVLLNAEKQEGITIKPFATLLKTPPIEQTITDATPKSNNEQSDPSTTELHKSLLCDEQILITSSSSASASSSSNDIPNITSPTAATTATSTSTTPASVLDSAKSNTTALTPPAATMNNMLNMLSSFNMLTWKERIGTARGTKLAFQLNEFNLIQIHERCPPRHRIHTAYEKPLSERTSLFSLQNVEAGSDNVLYCCRRCNTKGAPADFLAPEFCSLECLKRNKRKLQRDVSAPPAQQPARKRPRKDTLAMLQQQQKQQQQQQLMLENTTSILGKKYFLWSTYLTGKYGAIAAPIDLFLNPFPTGPNGFQIGMKLEAIDPENCALFCVCTVVDLQGYRLRLTFDGYDPMYDFWVNADSMDIFPPGWCAKTNRVLQPPKGIEVNKFSWPNYLAKTRAPPAQRQLFTHLNASSLPTHNPFKVNMHLEAEDLNDTGKLCVARIADVLDDRIRVHFDGWDDCYDYWVDINSPYIHPCGWHEGRQQLIVPPEFENIPFTWSEYINQQGSLGAHKGLFAARNPIEFKPNMKLEVVDPRNPSLIRPASVVGRKGHRIKLHLDCWPLDYCFWLEDDSPDLHPIGWCDATCHELEPPPGYQMRPVKVPCRTNGCRGIGNAKRLQMNVHTMRDCCPYAPKNWRKMLDKPPRIYRGRHPYGRSAARKSIKNQQQQQIVTQIHNQIQKPQQNSTDKQLCNSIVTRRAVQQEKMHSAAQLERKQCETLNAVAIKKEPNDENDAVENDASNMLSASAATTKATSLNGDTRSTVEASIQIAKEFLCDYGPRLQQNYALWQKNFNLNADKIKRNPLLWTTVETSAFIECLLKCKETAKEFARQDIDGTAMLLLQQSDLTDMLGLKLGPAVKLYTYILQLRTLAVTKFDLKLSVWNESK